MAPSNAAAHPEIDSGYAWARLAACLALGSVGGVGMWSIAVALPAVQAEFGVARGAASLPYTLTMLGVAFGGVALGRLADAKGIVPVVLIGMATLAAGFVAASRASSLTEFALIQGVLIGGGTAATFGPLVADISHWFLRRRGLAVALCASGNYFAGAIWPPILQRMIETYGWRSTYLAAAAIAVALMLPLVVLLRRPSPHVDPEPVASTTAGGRALPLGLPPNVLFALLLVAGLGCCVGMSMPQVHIVAYCGDLGYGLARGAEMLSVMLAAGVVSRLASGWISDRIGGLATLLLGSALQCLMLIAYLPFDGLTQLYVVSALFGLVQGGIVPSYALIVREQFPAAEAGWRVSTALMATVVGMALGGWISGLLYDLTGSYRAAFLNGIGWNLLNIAIALMLFQRWMAGRGQGAGRTPLAVTQ